MMNLVPALIIWSALILLPLVFLGGVAGRFARHRGISVWLTVPISFGVSLVLPALLIALAAKYSSDPSPFGGLGMPTPFFETPMAQARDSIVGGLKTSSLVLFIFGWIAAQSVAWFAYRSTHKYE